MRKMKKWLLSTMALAFSATMALSGASCAMLGKLLPNKNSGSNSNSSSTQEEQHTHAYTDTVTDPTCTEEGYTTHTCACGESYVDTTVAALGHDYETKITKYPSATQAGERTNSCTRCDSATTEEIAMLTVSMPKVSDVLVGVIGSVNAKIAVDEGSTIVYATEFENTTVTLGVAEAVLNTQEGVLAGHIKMDLTVEIETENGKSVEDGSLYVYVNGESIGAEMVNPDGTENKQEGILSEEIYKAIAKEMGITYDDVVALSYVGGEFASFAPAFFDLVANEVQLPVVTESYINSLQTLFQAVGQDIIVETQEGTNSVYTLDLSALGKFVDEVKDETICSYIDKVYGEGSMKAIRDFVVDLPAMKVKNIANTAITLADTYGIDVEHIYYLVNFVAAQAGATDFDIQKEIENRYDMTLAALILPAEGGLTLEALQAELQRTLNMIAGMTIDDLYNAFVANNNTVVPDGGVVEPKTDVVEEEFSITDQISALIAQLPEMVSASITFDEEGNFVACNLLSGPYTYTITVVDGVYTLVTEVQGVVVTIMASEDSFKYSVISDGTCIAKGHCINTDAGWEMDFVLDGNDCLDLVVTTDANDNITSVDFVLREMYTDYDYEYDEFGNVIDATYVEEFREVADIDYTATYNENSACTSAELVIRGWHYKLTADSTPEMQEEEEIYEELAKVTYQGSYAADGTLTNASLIIKAWNRIENTITDMLEGTVIHTIKDEYREELNLTYTDNGEVYIDARFALDGKITIDEEKVENGANWTMTVIDLTNENGVSETLAQFTAGYVEEGTVVTYTWNGQVYEDEIGEVLDGTLVVDNGEIVHYDFMFNNWGGSGMGERHNYIDEDGVECVYYKEVEETYAIHVSYDKTADGEDVSFTYTTYQTTKTGTEKFDAIKGEWVTVEEEVDVDEYTNAYGMGYTENSVTLSVDGVEFVVTVLDNGIEFNAGDMVVLTLTMEENTLHIGYAIEMLPVSGEVAVAGEGGISITIS